MHAKTGGRKTSQAHKRPHIQGDTAIQNLAAHVAHSQALAACTNSRAAAEGLTACEVRTRMCCGVGPNLERDTLGSACLPGLAVQREDGPHVRGLHSLHGWARGHPPVARWGVGRGADASRGACVHLQAQGEVFVGRCRLHAVLEA